MNKIALITDSSCDLPKSIVEENNIHIVPLRIKFSDREYSDGEISLDEIYNKIEDEIPTTSMPSPSDLLSKLEIIKNMGYTHCIAITISSGLSGTYNMFKLMSNEISDLKINVIDSRILSMPLGFLVMKAAEMIKANTPYDQIIDSLEQLKQKAKGFFIVDTLEYLKKGGRIGRVAATLGTLLNIKPIISVDENGKYYPFSKARGKAQAIDKLIEPLILQLEHTKLKVSVLDGKAHEEAKILYDKIKSFKNITSLYMTNISPSLVVHTGPGLLGIAFCPDEE